MSDDVKERVAQSGHLAGTVKYVDDELRPSKECRCCGRTFLKRARDSLVQWNERVFCSPVCSNKSKEFKPLHIRFWEKVVKSEGNACWKWTGVKDIHGYGVIHISGRGLGSAKAHRVSYEMRYGPIKQGSVICHSCDNPECTNPNHLFEGTQKDNVRDASRKGRLNKASLLNLRPGKKGFHGAGPISVGEMLECLEA